MKSVSPTADPVATDWLAARAAASPRALALAYGSATWTYAELDAHVDRLCALLVSRGVLPGDHLAARLPSTPTFVCLVHAAARLGLVLVPVNSRLTPAEAGWQIDHADARWLVTAEGDEHAATPGLPQPALIALPAEPGRLAEALAAQPARRPGVAQAREPGAIQAIVFTSGTTGRSKGAMVSFANHFWSAIGSASRLGAHPGDRWLSCLPLYHVGGLSILFRSCIFGSAVELHETFDPGRVRASLGAGQVTLLSLVPTMLYRLLEQSGADWRPPLRTVLLGGAAAPADLLARAAAAGVPVALTYGLTEAASQVATASVEETRRKPGSAGRPLLFTAVDICDETGRRLPDGAAGEIVISGPTVMAGYYRDDDATESVLRDGRLRTGDIGLLDAEGDLWVLDRRSDLIVCGGENVYPAEVENVLRSHPAVESACVVGLPDAEWGQQVAAVVTLREAAEVPDLLAFARDRLAGYKLPRLIVVADSLPLTSSGKVARRLVADQLMAGVNQ
jgi:O-succinylbenzoic acid--CoA ligase